LHAHTYCELPTPRIGPAVSVGVQYVDTDSHTCRPVRQGWNVGLLVGLAVGVVVGNDVGAVVGMAVGKAVGESLGRALGIIVGASDGTLVGELEGAVGDSVGGGVDKHDDPLSPTGHPVHSRPGTWIPPPLSARVCVGHAVSCHSSIQKSATRL
jgi:hypothetical protein